MDPHRDSADGQGTDHCGVFGRGHQSADGLIHPPCNDGEVPPTVARQRLEVVRRSTCVVLGIFSGPACPASRFTCCQETHPWPPPELHTSIRKGVEIAETILLPGDPLRAKFIAETYLDDVRCFNEVRGMLGFTGTYRGTPVSVMGTGMGIPSISLYTYELDPLLRCEEPHPGRHAAVRMQEHMELFDVVIAQGASTDSNYLAQFDLPGQCAAPVVLPPAGEGQARRRRAWPAHARRQCAVLGHRSTTPTRGLGKWMKMGILAVEMESAGLFANAAAAGVDALAMFTVSDHLLTARSDHPRGTTDRLHRHDRDRPGTSLNQAAEPTGPHTSAAIEDASQLASGSGGVPRARRTPVAEFGPVCPPDFVGARGCVAQGGGDQDLVALTCLFAKSVAGPREDPGDVGPGCMGEAIPRHHPGDRVLAAWTPICP